MTFKYHDITEERKGDKSWIKTLIMGAQKKKLLFS